MTDEQRAMVDRWRGPDPDKGLWDRVLDTLIAAIDAQEAELQTARDTIARYEAMMEYSAGIEFADGSKVFRPCRRGEFHDKRWRYLDWSTRSDGESYLTCFDAYDALKEEAI